MTDLLPNFVIAGAPKAGTSSLFGWIADHPDALGSREKETYFFVDPGTHMYRPKFNGLNGLDAYSDQFEAPESGTPKIILEATPSYLYMAQALEQIPDLPTKPRCLFVLREPAAQIFSLYQYFRDNWDWIPSSMTFKEFLDAARDGSHEFKGNELAKNALQYARYVDFLIPWRERLGEDRIMVMTFEDLVKDQTGSTARIAEWLGLDASFYESYAFPRENETYAPKNRALQRLNIMVRDALPKGKAYDALRSLYRKANTQKPGGAKDDDKAIMAELRADFADSNVRLEREFDLNLSSWAKAA